MKKLAYLALSGTALLLALAACNDKDSDPTPAPTPTPSKTALLTAKTWKITDAKLDGQSLFAFTPDCGKDDLYKFNTDKSATFDEGALKCATSDPQSSSGSWDLTSNETKLKITDPDGTIAEGTIKTLTSSTIVLTDYTGFGNTAAEVTYTAQ